MPEMDVVAGDSYNSSPTDPQLMGPEAREKHAKGLALPAAKKRIPMIEVPLGATEDRICGTIDIERALSEGVKVCMRIARVVAPLLRDHILTQILPITAHPAPLSTCVGVRAGIASEGEPRHSLRR